MGKHHPHLSFERKRREGYLPSSWHPASFPFITEILLPKCLCSKKKFARGRRMDGE